MCHAGPVTSSLTRKDGYAASDGLGISSGSARMQFNRKPQGHRYMPMNDASQSDAIAADILPADVSTFTAIRRGLARRCPRCGEGNVLSGYLTREPACTACELDLTPISADDGPAWATLLVVGHVVAPLVSLFGRDDRIPIWLAILVLSAIMLVGVWWCLPRAKGLFIALIWSTGATGEDVSPEILKQDAETHNRPDAS